MKNETQKRGRGRPKGGVSFTEISLEALIEKVGLDAVIPVSRVWLEKAKGVSASNSTPEPQKDATEGVGILTP